MLDKAINHVIKARESKISARKIFRELGVWIVTKSYIHAPKPQIQSVEPRRRRLGIRIIPCIFGEEGRINRLGCVFCVFLCVKMCLGERKNVQRMSKQRAKPRKVPSFLGLEVPGAFYSTGTLYEAVALQGLPPSNSLGSS